MARILITGMSGAGKSTLIAELSRRGHRTVDTDHGEWTAPDGEWDVPRMTTLLEEADIIVSGTVSNQGKFTDRFDHIVLVSAPTEVLLHRLETRTNNLYGKTSEQRADVVRYVDEVEPLLRRSATLELDGRRPIADLADEVERLLA